MERESINQWKKEEAQQRSILCEKGRRFLTVVVMVNLAVSLVTGILSMRFTGFFLQLVLAFFIFKGSKIAKSFYILLAFHNILSGFLCFSWQNQMTDHGWEIGGMDELIHSILMPAPQAVPLIRAATVIFGVFSILWGILMMVFLTKNRNLIRYLGNQEERRQ